MLLNIVKKENFAIKQKNCKVKLKIYYQLKNFIYQALN